MTLMNHTVKDVDAQFVSYHALLLPYAYNIVGDSLEAEDVVQETLSHYFMSSTDHVQDPLRYLTRSVINRAITARKRIEARKETYKGQWLPSPVSTEETVYNHLDRDHIANYSLMVLSEHLTPKERAVYILKESFDLAHSELAHLLNISVENSRQLYNRARKKLKHDIVRPVPDNSAVILRELTDAMLEADIEKVKQLLADDVQSVSDGGNTMRAAPNVVRGRVNVAKFLQAMFGKYFIEGSSYSLTKLNHQPAILFSRDHIIYRCIILEIEDNAVANVSIIINPEKLQSLQPHMLSR